MQKQLFLLVLLLCTWVRPADAFWMWTPETNRWINPKFNVKETPTKQFEYAKEFYDQKDYDKAMSEFAKLVRNYPRSKEAADAEFYTGLCLEAQNKAFEAFKAYQRVIDRYPFSDRAVDVVQKQYDIGLQMMEGEAKKNFVGGILGSSYNVVEVFRAVIKNAPYGPLAPQAQYKIGLYLQGERLYQEARDEFEKVVNDYPDSEWATAAKYQLALSDAKRSTGAEYDQKVTQEAVEGFKEFVKENPDAELSAKAQDQIKGLREKEAENNFLIAEFYEKQKNYSAAKLYFGNVARDFEDTSWAKKAQERLLKVEVKESKGKK